MLLALRKHKHQLTLKRATKSKHLPKHTPPSKPTQPSKIQLPNVKMSDKNTSTLQSYVDQATGMAQSALGSLTGNNVDKVIHPTSPAMHPFTMTDTLNRARPRTRRRKPTQNTTSATPVPQWEACQSQARESPRTTLTARPARGTRPSCVSSYEASTPPLLLTFLGCRAPAKRLSATSSAPKA